MKNKLWLVLALLLSFSTTVYANEEQIQSFYNQHLDIDTAKYSYTVYAPNNLPKNYSEFRNRCQNMLKTPAGAIKMYFDALFVYADANTRKEGQKMLRYVMHTNENWDKAASYSTFVSRLKDPTKHYIFRSYAKGTSPENAYNMSTHCYSINISKIVDENDYMRVNLVSSGADSSRIMWVKQFNDGLWYVINNSGSYVDVRKPQNIQNNSHDADYD